jgi:hypothetical protein
LLLDVSSDTLQVLAGPGVRLLPYLLKVCQRHTYGVRKWLHDSQQYQLCLEVPGLGNGMRQCLFGQGRAVKGYQNALVHQSPSLLGQSVNLANWDDKQQTCVSPVQFTDYSLRCLDHSVHLRLVFNNREQSAVKILLTPKQVTQAGHERHIISYARPAHPAQA